MMEKEYIVLALFLAGIAGFVYGLISQVKLKRLRSENQKTEGALDNIKAEQLVLSRRMFAGYGIFIVSGVIMGFI